MSKCDFATSNDFLFVDGGVLCCECALSRVGLTTFPPGVALLLTEVQEFCKKNLVFGNFIYKESIDTEHYLIRNTSPNEKILKPTAERAIVESIQLIDQVDEGILIEALQNYLWLNKDLSKLYEVAEFFKLDKGTLDYWLQEARDYENEG